MGDAELCEELPWDSAFFGVPIAQALQSHADAAACDAMRHWCIAHNVRCLYFLCRDDDAETRRALEAAGFLFVGSRVTLERSLERDVQAPVGGTRAATAGDVALLRAIASASHRDTRFYVDGHFDLSRCDELYATWIEKSVHGYADDVIVAERDGRVAGYVTLHATPADRPARIGLIAVAAEYRHQGVGRDLVRAVLRAAAGRGLPAVAVATAGANAAALALYTREGFRTTDMSVWYHCWSGDADR